LTTPITLLTMVRACVSGWTWSSGSQDHASVEGRGPDGEEDVRRDRYICEILVHWHAGRSKNEIAGSPGLSRNTVRRYAAAAEAAGMVPGGPAVSQARWAELAREWFPELADTCAARK
jgi:hypothetical protein